MYTFIYTCLYILGLYFIAMPPGSLPYFEGRDPGIRLMKHGLGLGIFAVGTMNIHSKMREHVGFGFILTSCILMILLIMLRVYFEKSTGKGS